MKEPRGVRVEGRPAVLETVGGVAEGHHLGGSLAEHLFGVSRVRLRVVSLCRMLVAEGRFEAGGSRLTEGGFQGSRGRHRQAKLRRGLQRGNHSVWRLWVWQGGGKASVRVLSRPL